MLEKKGKLENYLSIKSWAEEDRPREKLVQKGKHNLSDAELLAIIMGSGSTNESALSLAQRVLSHYGNNLNELGKSSIAQLTGFKGIGEAKAVSIIAAMELGRRREITGVKVSKVVRSSQDAYQEMRKVLSDQGQEEFWILMLNQGNKVIGKKQISIGGINKTLADARVIFKAALEEAACSVILFHNHPSGSLKPSEADIQLTRKLYTGGAMLDIMVLDHLILTGQGYFSFADEGLVFGEKQ